MLAVVSPAMAADKAFDLFTTPQYRSKKTPPDIFTKAERMQFVLNEKKVKGWRWNERAEKKLLILHGYESSVRKFDHHISRAIKKGYGVYAFDAPAHGNSEGKRIHMLNYVEMIRMVEQLYGKMDAYLAHSFGGMSVCHYLEKAPHSKDTKVVLIAPATENVTAIDGFFKFLQLNDKVRNAFDQKIKDLSGHFPTHYSIPRTMKHIKASVLWVHDEDDQVTPLKDVEKLILQQPPNVEFLITKGLGHNRIYRDNEVKRKIFSFLWAGNFTDPSVPLFFDIYDINVLLQGWT